MSLAGKDWFGSIGAISEFFLLNLISVFQSQVNPNIETGVNLGWTASSNTTSFGVAVKYVLDKNGSVRAKINNSSQIGLGYQQKLREGVTVTLSTLIDGKNFNQGGHKIGLALELET